jgi:ketosteroid isomerase-like protein
MLRIQAKSPLLWNRLLALCLVFVLLGVLPLQAGTPRAKKHEYRHEIDQLEEQWRDAILSSNIAAMDSLLSDDYMAITATGILQTKEQALANLRDGRVHFTSLELFDRKVRFYGTTALVTSQAEIRATLPEKDISGNYRYTRVYVRNARGEWKIVSFETNRIHDPGDHK